jgi:hypothetical protein
MSVVIGGISGPGWCQQPDPTGTSPVTTSARTYTTLRDSIGKPMSVSADAAIRSRCKQQATHWSGSAQRAQPVPWIFSLRALAAQALPHARHPKCGNAA